MTSPNLTMRTKLITTGCYLVFIFSPFMIPTYGYPLGHFTFGIPNSIWVAYFLLEMFAWLVGGVIIVAVWEDV